MRRMKRLRSDKEDGEQKTNSKSRSIGGERGIGGKISEEEPGVYPTIRSSD